MNFSVCHSEESAAEKHELCRSRQAPAPKNLQFKAIAIIKTKGKLYVEFQIVS